MAAPTKRPTAGVRYAIERSKEPSGEDATTTIYRGFAHLPDRDWPLEVRVDEARSSVTATLAEAEGAHVADLEKAAAALVKAAVRSAKDAGRALPWRIVRWRGA